MRTVFLGTSELAATVLERLAVGPHRPELVVTRPARPSGRGRKLTAPPVARAAERLGLPVEQPERVNDPPARAAIERVREADLDELVLVVCAFGALIREPLLSAYPLLNVHPSLLPRWRGAAPIERAIMAGDAQSGVSIMRLTAGLDSGPVCLAAAETIAPRDTYGSLAARLAALGGELLAQVLDGWQRGERPRFHEQDEALTTYAEKIASADRVLDPARPALELERVVRALHPHIGARIALSGGDALGVRRAAALPADGAALVPRRVTAPPDGLAPTAKTPLAVPAPTARTPLAVPAPTAGPLAVPAPGVLAVAQGRLLYGTVAGALELLEVQPPGGRAMDAGAYLRGHELPRL